MRYVIVAAMLMASAHGATAMPCETAAQMADIVAFVVSTGRADRAKLMAKIAHNQDPAQDKAYERSLVDAVLDRQLGYGAASRFVGGRCELGLPLDD